MRLELGFNILVLSALSGLWAAMSATRVEPALPTEASIPAELRALEDHVAQDPDDRDAIERLTERYLDYRRPEMVLAVLGHAAPAELERPQLLHFLARAYEQVGALEDALTTADLALTRCGAALGSGAFVADSPGRYVCAEREYARFDRHRNALGHMARWGVTDPMQDLRRAKAYRLAARRARVASSLQ